MPRTTKKPSRTSVMLLFIAGGMLFLIQQRDWFGIAFILIFSAAATAIVLVVIPRLKQNALLARVDDITESHLDALIRQRTILIRDDAYGKPVLDKWHAELKYFVAHHVRPALKKQQQQLLDRDRKMIVEHVSQQIADAAEQRPKCSTIPEKMTPAEFESSCADQLRACGWSVRVTPQGHDQGVDVIAEKDGIRVALQCKLYSSPVGNKAVQEIAAGRVHQHAHFGAVVTNQTFTASAKALAATNGIRLLHHTDLPRLEAMLSQPTLFD